MWPGINCHILLVISRLHEVLMDLQDQQLKQLSTWLYATEARIKQMEAQHLGPEIEDLKHQIEEHKVKKIFKVFFYCIFLIKWNYAVYIKT